MGPGLRAVFLDRDGVLVRSAPYASRPEQIALYPGAAEALIRLEAAGYRRILVTNQSGVARGLIRSEELERLHSHLQSELMARGAALDGIYACPHHPEIDGPCPCRKPAPGLFLRAAAELGLSLGDSYVVGDRWSDIDAGLAAGIRGILVETGHGKEERSAQPARREPVVKDLAAAALWILRDRS